MRKSRYGYLILILQFGSFGLLVLQSRTIRFAYTEPMEQATLSYRRYQNWQRLLPHLHYRPKRSLN